MPREQVTRTEDVLVKDGWIVPDIVELANPSEAVTCRAPIASVSWARGDDHELCNGSVELQVEIDTRHLLSLAESAIGEGSHKDPELQGVFAITAPMTRTELNHCIRTLKRARDAAFGADE